VRSGPHLMAGPALPGLRARPVKSPATRPPFALARRPALAPQSLSRRSRLPARSRSECCGSESSDRVAAKRDRIGARGAKVSSLPDQTIICREALRLIAGEELWGQIAATLRRIYVRRGNIAYVGRRLHAAVTFAGPAGRDSRADELNYRDALSGDTQFGIGGSAFSATCASSSASS
jgi:hypothetical protein